MTAESAPGRSDADADTRPAAQEGARLDELRARITAIDETLIRTMAERQALVLEIGREKERLGLPILDPGREAQVVRKAVARARELGLDEETARDVLWRLIASARHAQSER